MTCRRILCHHESLSFPPEANLTPEAVSLIRGFLCDRNERLGRNGTAEIKSRAPPRLDRTASGSTRRLASPAPLLPLTRRSTARALATADPFFRGVDWSSLRRGGKAPFRPRVSSSAAEGLRAKLTRTECPSP